MEKSQSDPTVSGVVVTTSRVVRLAVAAYLARCKGQSRLHTESDLRGYLVLCELRGLDPLAASRPHVELYVRWLQEVRRYRPSTVSRRMSVVGLRIFEATGSDIADLGEEHGNRVLRVHAKGDKVVLVPLPPAVGRAIERAVEERTAGPILLTSRSTRMDRHCATRRLRRLAE